MKKLIPALGLALCVSFIGCTSTGVQASAESDSEITSDAELSCCAKAILANKKECPECGSNVENKVVCPASGTVYDAE